MTNTFPAQVLNVVGAVFMFTSPTGLGQNAFYGEDFGGGIIDAKELEICFEKSGGVTSIQYMVKRNILAMLDIQTAVQPVSHTMATDHTFGHVASEFAREQAGPAPSTPYRAQKSLRVHE
jgi:hypothetical protein